jgi:hypothetical protein
MQTVKPIPPILNAPEWTYANDISFITNKLVYNLTEKSLPQRDVRNQLITILNTMQDQTVCTAREFQRDEERIQIHSGLTREEIGKIDRKNDTIARKKLKSEHSMRHLIHNYLMALSEARQEQDDPQVTDEFDRVNEFEEFIDKNNRNIVTDSENMINKFHALCVDPMVGFYAELENKNASESISNFNNYLSTLYGMASGNMASFSDAVRLLEFDGYADKDTLINKLTAHIAQLLPDCFGSQEMREMLLLQEVQTKMLISMIKRLQKLGYDTSKLTAKSTVLRTYHDTGDNNSKNGNGGFGGFGGSGDPGTGERKTPDTGRGSPQPKNTPTSSPGERATNTTNDTPQGKNTI